FWFRNPQTPATTAWTRHQYSAEDVEGHDVVLADLSGDTVPDIVQMYDASSLFHWYERPADPTAPWTPHLIWAEGIHAGFGPQGIGDLDGDGDNDVFRADIWLENLDGDGLRWAEHPVPFGDRVGPWGRGARSVVVDLDGDGDNDVVATECDMVFTHAAVLYNDAGDGSVWRRVDLPLTDPGLRNSLHSLQVADFDIDGDLDIFTVEQEDMRDVAEAAGEVLPAPRWFIWENDGAGGWTEHVIFDGNLGGHEAVAGDVDGDGDLDLASKVWLGYDGNANGGREHADFLESRLIDRLDDGRGLDGWLPPTGGEFTVVAGAIECRQGTGNTGGLLLSDREYGDFGLEFEAWPDWGVDTGVYLRTTADEHAYQLCIDYQPDNPLGGIYGAGFGTWDEWSATWDYTVLDESHVQGDPALFELADWAEIWRPGAWNRFRARVEGNPPHLEVWINDRKVTDRIETELRHEARGRIGLQVHEGAEEWPAGAVARFRNLKVYDLAFFDRVVRGGPSIRITAPLPGATFPVGATIPVRAEASGGETPVASVALYIDATLLAEFTAGPYEATWTGAPAGAHVIRGRVTNGAGETAEATVSFEVVAGPAHTVHLEAEEYDEMSGVTDSGTMIESCDDGDWIRFDDVDLGAGYRALFARVGKPATTAGRFEVRLDDLTTGTVVASLSPTGTGDWNDFEEQGTTATAVAGVHDVYVAFVGEWGVGNFDWFEFRDPVNLDPVVALTSPTDGARFAAGSAIPLAADASDPDGRVVALEFIADGALLFTATAEPFEWSWGDAAVGEHVLVARATDDFGAMTSSTSVTIEVAADGGADDSGGCGCRAAGPADGSGLL
ncbi:MAG: carbohydrate-binding protein, partial [Deltaproteobacteria bacterium]|nr:carbohydrate-binding protein [Deltaproteobacteria bacterium]